VTNEDLTRTMDTSDKWIRDHTGIRERRYAPDDIDTSDLGVIAVSEALKDAGVAPNDVDVLICATSTPDRLVPSTASYIANKMELRATAFDIGAACTGFIYGLAVAEGLMHTQGHETIVVCAADKFSRVIDPKDRANSILFGDAAGAAVLTPERPVAGLEILDLHLSCTNRGADLVRIPIGGHFEMEGRAVKPIALPDLINTVTVTLERNRLALSDLRGFVCHQANLRLIETLADHLGVEEHQHWHDVEMFANRGAASVVTAFCSGLDRNAGDFVDGDLFLLTAFGAGFTNGSALLRWVGPGSA